MSVEKIVQIIDDLVAIHNKLLTISQQKTDFIKEANNEQLVKLLLKERQLIEEAERKESERETLVAAFFEQITEQPKEQTVSELLTYIQVDEEREKLEKSVASLIDLIVKLREKEQLNNGLLQQSMQLTQLTLSMIQPETTSINYGNQKKQQQPRKNLSVFDSKA